ncbi:hypothetical protein VTP01DRAFT_2271 [Rhizomucor pusillus]|uniref:uncharacterized protein n=1 Tax=Rhizomucor pusillus TaxID=4840 RepID=UPI0037441C19
MRSITRSRATRRSLTSTCPETIKMFTNGAQAMEDYKHWIREPNVNEEGRRLIESLQQRDSGHSVTDASNDNQPWIQERNNIMSLSANIKAKPRSRLIFSGLVHSADELLHTP